MSSEPKTIEALLSCDTYSTINEDIIILDTAELAEKYGMKLGDTVRIPIAVKACATPVTGDSIMMALDSDGRAWAPALHDGVWYRQEILL